DPKAEASPFAARRQVPREVAAALGVAQDEEPALRAEMVERPSHEAAQCATGRASAPECRGQLEHEPELPLRAPLVLAEIADQLGEGEEIVRPEEVAAPEADV